MLIHFLPEEHHIYSQLSLHSIILHIRFNFCVNKYILEVLVGVHWTEPGELSHAASNFKAKLTGCFLNYVAIFSHLT